MDYNASKDKVPPHNLEAEQATLGALLLDWSAMSDIVTMLNPDKFYSIQNRTIYEALVSLFRQSIHGDTLTLINELTKSGNLDKAGGTAYVAALTDTVPTSANVDYYAKIVVDQATRRDLIRISSEGKALSFDETKESRSILDEAEKNIFKLADKNQTTSIQEMKDLISA